MSVTYRIQYTVIQHFVLNGKYEPYNMCYVRPMSRCFDGPRISLQMFVIWPAEYHFQAPVVQKVDNAIHRINHYPLDRAIDFPKLKVLWI